MEKPKSKKKLSNKKAVTWSLIILAIIVSIIVFKNYDSKSEHPDQQKDTKTPEQVCREWQSKYMTLAYNELPNGTLKVGAGETWVVRLDPEEWSDTIDFDAKWRITEVDSLFIHSLEDDLKIVTTPNMQNADLGTRDKLKFRGNHCMLIRTFNR